MEKNTLPVGAALDTPAAVRLKKALVTILIEEESGVPEIGSGVLAKIGGREFILTAGHNVWSPRHKRLNVLRVLMDVGGFIFRLKPDAVVNVYVEPPASGYPDPDVAVIEPSLEHAVLSPSREPFEQSELGGVDGDSASQQLLVGGFPGDLARLRQDWPKIAALSKNHPIDATCMRLAVHSMPHRRAMSEPRTGRGLHVYVEFKSAPEFGGSRLERPGGFSGGPLVLPADRGQVVGLVRSKSDMPDGAFDVWCEPVLEAVRLLTKHPDAAVVEAATGIVQRLDSKHSVS